MTANELLRIILSDPERWLWSPNTQVELFRLLPALWEALEQCERERLTRTLLEGPPRAMFQEDVGQEEWEQLHDHSVWERLTRLRTATSELPEDAVERLEEIESTHPSWYLAGDEKEDYPVWSESWVGVPSDFTGAQLRELDEDRAVDILIGHPRNREGVMNEWEQAASEDNQWALRILRRVCAKEAWDPSLWLHGLRGIREPDVTAGIARDYLDVIEQVPVEALRGAVREIATTVRWLAGRTEEETRPRILMLWDSLTAEINEPLALEEIGPLASAINHSGGILAEALLALPGGTEHTRDEGLDEDVRVRLERLLDMDNDAGRMARVIICSRLAFLHYLDSEWTARMVVPLLDWKDEDEAVLAWSGYLWSPLYRTRLPGQLWSQ